LQEGVNALRAADGVLLLKHGLQKSADQAGDLTGICRRSAAAADAEGGGQAFEITLLGGTGRVV
jgi:hypothetical protein